MDYKDYNSIKPVLKSALTKMKIDIEIINECLNCNKMLFLKLSEVNVIPENRSPNSKSNQSHIHLSGKNKSMFYSPKELEEAKLNKRSTEDEMVSIYLITANLNYLANYKNNVNNMDHVYSGEEQCKFIKSYTYKKITIRKDGSEQVQLSKLRLDDKTFVEFRRMLYVNYVIVFFERKDGRGYNVIGIPNEDIDQYNINVPALLLDNEKNSTSQENNYSVDESDLILTNFLKEAEVSQFKINDESLDRHVNLRNISEENQEIKKREGRKYLKELEINQEIGEFGERLVFYYEKQRLKKSKQPKLRALTDKIEWTSKEKGNLLDLGYDIKSYDLKDGKIIPRYIEVKTTIREDRSFKITYSEIKNSRKLNVEGVYVIAHIYNVDFNNKSFEYCLLEGAIEDNYELEPIVFRANRK
ncbi:protein NO VEIN domain-containing protein [Clostridium beijerinckii]|uniref:protein NO VEIN domain-containing protein n=1 Tax=Clostridium beijerinckii TaxID=1520 RepID=UPI001F1CA040|nr:DUF3883 domain-containing protein [Clostridium beijerinckii]